MFNQHPEAPIEITKADYILLKWARYGIGLPYEYCQLLAHHYNQHGELESDDDFEMINSDSLSDEELDELDYPPHDCDWYENLSPVERMNA